MADSPLYLGLDLGTSSVKALLLAGGCVVAAGAAEYPIHQPQPGFAEQDPDDWWQASVAATRQALAALDASQRARIAGIGLSGQMHGTVLLDAAQEVLAPAIIWSDTRTGAVVRELTARIGADRLIALAGSPLATGFQAATIRWLQHERPDLWRRVRHVLAPKDYLRWRLTGRIATDPSDASGTLLLDVHTRDWSPEILTALDLDRALLPPLLPSATCAGALLPEAATALGLPAGLPVATGGADAPCAALGAGIVEAGTLLLTFSTGAQVLVPALTPRGDARGRLHTFCNVLAPGANRPGWYTMGATMVAGLALRWLRDTVFALSGEDTYPQMTAWAAAVPPGARGLIFVPYLIGERTPHMDPQARAIYLGLTASHGRGELVRAAIEGVAFAAYDAYLALRELGADPRRIVVAGGGARSELWRRIVADLFALPVQPLATADQSAVGAAILAAAAVEGADPATLAADWATLGDPLAPDLALTERYRALFAIYQRAYTAHREDFATLAAFA